MEDREASPSVSEALSSSGNFPGAGDSPARGIPEWSTLDTRYEIRSSEQRELVRRSRALVANSGLARVLRKRHAERLCPG